MKNLGYLIILISSLLILPLKAHDCALIQPSNPEASVPELIYYSSFKKYQSFKKIKRQPWRQANDNVKQSDHAGHMNMQNMNMEESTSDQKNPHADHSMHMKH